jgi:Tol biopolymer transport system component
MCKNGKALTAQPKSVSFASFGSVTNTNDSEKQLVVSNDGSVLSYTAAPSGLVKPTPLNSKYWKPGSSFTSDGKNLIFVSKRKDGLGGKDIYISKKQSDGTWSEPENLGMHINSTDDEESPFLSADGKTLFYLSKGHNSMGGFDIFKSSLDLNTNTWSSPENVGYPLNTADNDVFLIKANEINVGFLNR